ncbi:MAG: ECF-type sigma factor [Dehalococcoidia bacterium]|nr:ECF-type sigma factor [Dehalococcoidia bacterium]
MHNVADADLRLDLRRACERLTERQRAVVVLVVEGYTQTEIGKQLAITQATVFHHLVAIRAHVEDFPR